MIKDVNSYGEEYYHDYGDALKISDIIEALTKIKEQYGEIYVRKWNDGILKAISFVEVKTTINDPKETAAVLSC